MNGFDVIHQTIDAGSFPGPLKGEHSLTVLFPFYNNILHTHEQFLQILKWQNTWIEKVP
jgi:hypothetical protein